MNSSIFMPQSGLMKQVTWNGSSYAKSSTAVLPRAQSTDYPHRLHANVAFPSAYTGANYRPARDLVNSRWALREITVAGQEIDVAPIRPIYLTVTPTRAQPNSLRVEFQSECYENQESPRRLHYIMQFSSSHQFAFVSGLQTDNQCDLQRRTYDSRFTELSSVSTSYAVEDGVLFLRGTDESTGEEIVITWERSPIQ